MDIMDKTRKRIHQYIDKTLNELHELGFRDDERTLSAVRHILNINSIINYVDVNANKEPNGHERIPSMDKNLKGWTCDKCTLVNYKDFKNCIACGNPAPR